MKKSIIYLGLALTLTLSSFAANNTSSNHYDPLCIAISKNDNETAKKMIAYGANVNDRYNGITPLMYAARYNNVEMLKELLNNGADLSLKDSRGNTALKYAELSNAKEAIEFLKSVKK